MGQWPRSEFGRLLADYAHALFNLYNVNATSLSAFVNVYSDRNDYALYEVIGDGIDTVGYGTPQKLDR